MSTRKARLFRFVWRANALIILAAGVCALVLVGILAATQLKWMFRERHVNAVVNTDTTRHIDETLRLGRATKISGQPWMLVDLSSEQGYDQGSYSKSAEAVRNYAFVSAAEPVRWLYDHNRFLVLDVTQLPGTSYQENDHPTALVSFLVVEEDTDHDRRLTTRDDAVLVFTRPDGSSRTTVLRGIKGNVSQEKIGDQVLTVYNGADGYASAAFSVQDFTKLREEKIVLPGGVPPK